MDFLKAEILRKRKQLEDKKLLNNGTNHFNRGELRKKEEEEYWIRQKRKKLSECGTNSPDRNSPRPSDTIDSLKEKSENDKEKIKPRPEVIRRLRERNQPIRLFGETDLASYQRLTRFQVPEQEGEEGLKNDYKAALDMVDQELLGNSQKATSSSLEVTIKEDSLQQEEIDQMKVKMFAAISSDEPFTSDCEEADYVLKYFKFVLCEWGRELNSRSKEEKLSFLGKRESATYTQTVEYIKPLFKQLKYKTLPSDILDSLIRIVAHCMDRFYIKANDAYLELAIGNSPWPLGVTNHGIHSRTAQEKIHAKNVAHVLNDESQRKYISSIKRLMTQAQRIFTTAPHRCVNFMGKS